MKDTYRAFQACPLLLALLLGACNKSSEQSAAQPAPAQPAPAQPAPAQPAESHQHAGASGAPPVASSLPAGKDEQREKVQLTHVHGLSYTPDGSRILIPSHHGLAIYDGARWSIAPGPKHDYMGFSATKNAIYSSGHPAPGSGLVNPFGVIKSTDGGQTWSKLGFEGESDFHLLTTGYETGAVYVINPHPNSKMKEQGLYYTLNDGFSWQRPPAKGMKGEPMSIAAHPTDVKTIAVGTEAGLFLSSNGGEAFALLSSGAVAGLFFDLNGKHLWYSDVSGQPSLLRLEVASKKAEKLALPEMQKDAVAYIAQNPVRKQEYAIATFKRSVYLTPDEGKTWRQIAKQGEPS